MGVSDTSGLAPAAQLFKVLGNESRLWLLQLIGHKPLTVGALVQATGMSQPLVSQHLRTLKQAGLVTADRHGKEVEYQLADHHVSHVIDDAIAHAQETEPSPPQTAAAEGA
ncbi:helix-turn-helix transcriptional regulator [Nesterenkonia sp. Hz 6-5]|nr:helix-turn-helix transcriptional regulator [Nesterenkonia haasae]